MDVSSSMQLPFMDLDLIKVLVFVEITNVSHFHKFILCFCVFFYVTVKNKRDWTCFVSLHFTDSRVLIIVLLIIIISVLLIIIVLLI